VPKEQVGFIGLGAMGSGMSKNLLTKGHPLTVHDLNQNGVDALVRLGAAAAPSPAAVAERSDVVFTVLPDGPDVEKVVLGPDGVLAGARPGLMLVECSTIDPAVSDRVRGAALAAGCRMVDAPLGKSSKEAQAGTLAFFVGATDEDFAAVLPLLRLMGTDIVRCGGPGSGAIVKIVTNLLGQTLLAANIEALVLGTKAGVSTEAMLSAFQLTAANNGQLRGHIPNQVLASDFRPGFRLALSHKDLSIGQAMAARLGVPLFTLANARQVFAMAIAQGKGDLAAGAVVEMFEQLAGVRLPRP